MCKTVGSKVFMLNFALIVSSKKAVSLETPVMSRLMSNKTFYSKVSILSPNVNWQHAFSTEVDLSRSRCRPVTQPVADRARKEGGKNYADIV